MKKISDTSENFSNTYQKVLERVMQGFTISESCKMCDISSYYLYDNMTLIQKTEISSEKATWNGFINDYKLIQFLNEQPDYEPVYNFRKTTTISISHNVLIKPSRQNDNTAVVDNLGKDWMGRPESKSGAILGRKIKNRILEKEGVIIRQEKAYLPESWRV